jgi:N-acetylglucosaminyldiphosphoundecaprenol N-acetyl-beta-D-mannosaminyltransferase
MTTQTDTIAPAEIAPWPPVAVPAAQALLGAAARPLEHTPALQPAPAAAAPAADDDLARPVYCVLGIPVDAVDMAGAIAKIEAAARRGTPFLLSTPNLDFLLHALADPEFRESLLRSDLCPADGAPIVWMARLLGIPIAARVAGSDIFEALKRQRRAAARLAVCLFGGAAGVAAAAAGALNADPGGLFCVRSIDPGYGAIEDMSSAQLIERINASEAHFLAVALGAAKGQAWLLRNHHRIRVPVRAHLGAAINFQAGTIERAPEAIRRWGLEWLWRIKEEPHLWRRYWKDGRLFLRLILTRVLPLAAAARWRRLRRAAGNEELLIRTSRSGGPLVLSLYGSATEAQAAKAVAAFRDALTAQADIAINLSGLRLVDARFLGLLLMLRKALIARGARLSFIGVSRRIERLFRRNEVSFLLSDAQP